MLYTVNTDNDGYILSVAHTSNDNVELDLESMELEYLNAYQLVEGVAVLDENRKEELITEQETQEKQLQIFSLMEQLKATDEDLLGFLEDLFSLKNPLTFISDMFNLMKNYATLVADRISLRQQIEQLKS